MARSFRLPLPAANLDKIRFPDQFVRCGASRQANAVAKLLS